MINAETPKPRGSEQKIRECQGCGGVKGYPMCADLSVGFTKGIIDATNGILDESYVDFSLCWECANDLVNALGFFVISQKRDLPKKKKAKKK